MAININKIRDERLTEDEKMELIADYLENGGGGEGGSSAKVLTLQYTEANLVLGGPDETYQFGNTEGIGVFATATDEDGKTYTLSEVMDMYKVGENIFLKNLPIVIVYEGSYGAEVWHLDQSMYIDTSPSYYSTWDVDENTKVEVAASHLEYMDITQYDLNGVGGIWETTYSDGSLPAQWDIQRVTINGEPTTFLLVEAVQIGE